MDRERNPIDCKYFTRPQCPNGKALKEYDNLVGEMYGGVVIDKRPVIKEAERICGECKSFEPKERR